MHLSPLFVIFLIATFVLGGLYVFVDKKMKLPNEELRDTYKVAVIIIYVLQLILLMLFVV